MKRLPKTLLIVCATLLALGVFISSTTRPVDPLWTLALPLGAVFYCLGLITYLLQDEAATFDEAERHKLDHAPPRPSAVPPRPADPDPAHDPHPDAAHPALL